MRGNVWGKNETLPNEEIPFRALKGRNLKQFEDGITTQEQ
jgi:hypothetical protein